MADPTFRQRARYWFDNTMSKGTKALIGWLSLITVALTIVGAALLVATSAAGDGPLGALWTSFVHILDASAITGDADAGLPFMIVMFVTTIGGLVILSSLIGVLTTGLDAKLEELRKGRSFVVESGHTLILGWSDQVFIVIAELVEANESERRACIVVLAGRDKVEMEDELRAKIPDRKGTKIVCRTGDPADPADIAMVNPDAAKSIVLLTSGEDDPDAQLVRRLLAVNHGGAGGCHVVGAVAAGRNLPAARLAGGRRSHLVDANDLMARLMVQTCRQSGLSVVYTDLLDFDGDEIYMAEAPALVGRPLAEAVHAYRTSALIGVFTRDGACHINPPTSAELRPGDRLILIAADDSAIELDDTRPAIDETAIVARGEAGNRPERTLVLGWNAKTRMILEQLDAYVAPGSVTDVVTDHPDAAAAVRAIGPTMRVQGLNFKHDDTTDRRLLESISPGSYDHIIALCSDDVDPHLADSKTLVTLLHLRDMAERARTRFKVVSEMADDRNRGLAQATQADDFIVSDKLISLLLTQTAENPHLSQVFDRLFSPDGSEIYLKPVEYYVRTGVQLNFYTVAESARRRGELAIGYRQIAGAQTAPGYGVVLNPDKARQTVLRPGDRVIVLAED